MPLLFLERFPWPSLRTYTALSALALLAAALSAYRALGRAPEAAAGSTAELQARGGPRALDVASFLLADSLCVWVRPGMAAGGSALSAPPPPGLPRAPPGSSSRVLRRGRGLWWWAGGLGCSPAWEPGLRVRGAAGPEPSPVGGLGENRGKSALRRGCCGARGTYSPGSAQVARWGSLRGSISPLSPHFLYCFFKN